MKSSEFKVSVSSKMRSIIRCMIQFDNDPYLKVFWRNAYAKQKEIERSK